MLSKNLFKNYIYPIAVFSGGMIGVGFLSLPYIALKTGIWVMLGYFLAVTALVVFINLIFTEISLKTPDYKRFPGFAKYYLGKRGEGFAWFTTILGTLGVLLVYLLVGGQFLASVFQPVFPGSLLAYELIYFFVVSVIIYFDIKLISKVEFWVLVLLFLSLLLVFAESFFQIKLSNIFSNFSAQGGPASGWQISNLFLPYGPLLFALWGTSLIPETEEMLVDKKKNLKKVITISTIIVSVFYFLFILLILAITGSRTTETALTGLKNFVGDGAVAISLFAGALATIVAFITQGIIFKKTLVFDLKIKHWQAFIITCFTPMILLLLGLKSFIPLLSVIGGFLLGINGILILLMYKKINGKNIIIYPLSLVFLLGIIYELIYFIK